MPLIALHDDDALLFRNEPEFRSGLQFGVRANGVTRSDEDIIYILGGRVAYIPMVGGGLDPDVDKYVNSKWLFPNISIDDRIAEFANWKSANISQNRFRPLPLGNLARIMKPVPSIIPMPSLPASPYGHLPFSTITNFDDVFYHFEPFPPPSARLYINSSGKWEIAAGTFANPPSELPFFPSGFAVTARNALPGLLPACFRYEIRPIAGQPMLCGAGVPLFGHSGGGVEVQFTVVTDNRGPVADPVFVSPL